MRVCCTANAHVGPTNDKEHGGMVGVLKDDEGKPNNLNTQTSKPNSKYMRNVRKQMSNGEKPKAVIKCYKEEAPWV